VVAVETAAEVAGGGRIGNTSSAEGVEKVLIMAPQFDVLQASAVTERVVGEVKDVVGFMVRQMNLEDVQLAVDGVNEAELPGQGVQGTNAAVANAANACRRFVMNVAGGEHGLATATEVGFVEAALDASLAVVKPSA
jgi:hypothetical protein